MHIYYIVFEQVTNITAHYIQIIQYWDRTTILYRLGKYYCMNNIIT